MIIDVWSDVVCPWCFIGRRRLQKALACFAPAGEVVIRHRAFELQPEISTVIPTSQLLASKYHLEPTAVKQMQANVCAIADAEGLCYDLDQTKSGNTRDSHRLLLWADEIGKQDELIEAMYSGYFERGLPLFGHQDLITIAKQVGIDEDEAQALLSSERLEAEVARDAQMAKELGATGVPFYVFDMKYGISGAQSVEVFTQTLERAWASRLIS